MKGRENIHEGLLPKGTDKFRQGPTSNWHLSLQQSICDTTKQFISIVRNIYKSHPFLSQTPNFEQAEEIITLLMIPSGISKSRNTTLKQTRIMPIDQESQDVQVMQEELEVNQVALTKSIAFITDEPTKKHLQLPLKKQSEPNGHINKINSFAGKITIQSGKSKTLWNGSSDSQSPVKSNVMEEDIITKLLENGEKKGQKCQEITEQKEQKILDALVHYYIKNKSLNKTEISNVAKQVINLPSFKASWRWVNQFIKRNPFVSDMLNCKATNEKESERFEFEVGNEENKVDQEILWPDEQKQIENFKIESMPQQEQEKHKNIEKFLRGQLSKLGIKEQLEKQRLLRQEEQRLNLSHSGEESKEKRNKEASFQNDGMF